jgi:hypothetical protein
MTSTYRLLLGLVLSIGLVNIGAGCGAMFNETTAVVQIDVIPPGARVSVDGLYVAQAPTQIQMPSARSHVVDIDADGYQRQTARIESRPSAGYIVLDCLLLIFIIPGVVALLVDGLTGNWRVLDADRLAVRMHPLPPLPPPMPRPP